MKIYVNAPGENWILDRYQKEWYQHNSQYSSLDPTKADILWMLDTYTWDRFNEDFLASKKNSKHYYSYCS